MTNFITYKNKNSLKKKYARLLQGGKTDIIGDKLGWWERRGDLEERPDDLLVTITPDLVNRPDVISFLYYGTSELEWLVLQYSSIVDPEQELTVGTKIRIPSKLRALSTISSKSSIPRLI